MKSPARKARNTRRRDRHRCRHQDRRRAVFSFEEMAASVGQGSGRLDRIKQSALPPQAPPCWTISTKARTNMTTTTRQPKSIAMPNHLKMEKRDIEVEPAALAPAAAVSVRGPAY